MSLTHTAVTAAQGSPGNWWTYAPVLMSHTMHVPSAEPLTMICHERDTARHVTLRVCPWSSCASVSALPLVFHTHTTWK